MIVVAIAAQQESIEYLNNVGVELYHSIHSPKGISDFYTSPLLDSKTLLMKKIEKLIPSKNFNFGYKKSEAVITLLRTPNNTFPIFWQGYSKDDVDYESPFSRY